MAENQKTENKTGVMNPYRQYMYSYPHKTAYGPLEGVFLGDYASCLTGRENGLYLHIPFCQSKCGYCNLFSVTGQSGEAVDRYLQAVERQCRQYQEVLEEGAPLFSQVVIGGGTPLYLTEAQLDRMFSMLHRYFHLEEPAGRDTVIETAPGQTTKEKLHLLKQAGVTRVSLGIQSFSERELSVLGRRHDGRRAREALALLQSFDFPCINVDFIYGIPGQTADSLLDSLKEAVSFGPDEIFLYPLYVKHGAGMERDGVVPDGGAAFAQYQAGAGFLRAAGFRQDSMRRFVRKQERRAYTECGFGTSLALGCGGRSYLGNLHFCSPYAVTRGECLARLAEYEAIIDYTKITHGFLLSEDEMRRRYVIRHLLIRPGLELARYKARFGKDVRRDFPLLDEWTEQGFARAEGGFLTLTQAGLDLSDYLGPRLTSSQVQNAMREWEESHERAYDII